MNIRQAVYDDLPAITAIYNHAVLHSVATFDTVTKTTDERRLWLDEHGDRYPVLVAEEAGCIIGWASLSRWSSRPAYDGTAEISIYFTDAACGKGFGSLLMPALLEAGKNAGLHTIIARISDGNGASIRLHEKFGFAHTGTLKEVGYKFGRYIDVHIMQCML